MLAATAKAVKDRADKTFTFTKKVVGMLSLWGLIFSLVTIGKLKVAFDYDDTLVFSSPAFAAAYKSGAQPFSPRFWRVVNTSYHLETIKPLPYAMAWVLRIFGFKVTIITPRLADGGKALRKEWRHLATQFVFAGGRTNKHKFLKKGNYVLFFGDSDSDIKQGRRAKVFSIRVKRSAKSAYREDYHPGSLRELVIPLSEF